MGLSTKGADTRSSVMDKKVKITYLREKHERLFELEGIGSEAKFIPKMAYIPRGGDERVIALFKSEIKGGEDVYTEFVSSEYDPEDPERRLWKWPYNEHWDEEYATTEPHHKTGHVRYLIPVDELLDVAQVHQPWSAPEAEEADEQFEMPDANNDAPINQLTIRDKAAIDWKLPVSRKPWLNDLIRQQFNNQK